MEALEAHEEQLALARQRFGRFLRLWFDSGDWSTKEPGRWAKAVGLPLISNNTVSFICNATQPKTSPKFFTAIGYLNQRLADRDYGPIKDRKLKDRIAQLQPVCHSNGTPWGAVDFFACYIGQLEPPPEFDTGPPPGKGKLLTPEVAQRISSCKHDLFERHAKASGLSKAEAWAQVKQHCSALTVEQVDTLQQVLSGWRSWTPQELEDLKTVDGHNAAVQALEEWCGMDLHQELRALALQP